jgi:hypothetical protein
MWSPIRPWSPIRQWLRALAGLVMLFDEALRFAAAVDQDPRSVSWSGGPSDITVRIRRRRDEAAREYGERAA